MALEVTTLLSRITAQLTNTVGLQTVSALIDESISLPLSSGTGANQADKIYSAERTILASANEDLDLAGALTDALGAALTFAKLKLAYFKAASGNTNSVQVTRPASNGVPWLMAAGDGISLLPGAYFLWVSPNATGVTVTAGTGDLINVANSAGSTSVTYRVVLIGTSA